MVQALARAIEPVFEFTGGSHCLDFTNTLGDSRARPIERLKTYNDMVAWGQQAGVLTDGEARRAHSGEHACVEGSKGSRGVRRADLRLVVHGHERKPQPPLV